jgi:carbamoyltransferase
MATVLGINAVFHDPAAAIVVDGEIVAAAEEERFSRRKHGKSAVPFSTWELPEASIKFCIERAGIAAADLDAIGYSYDPTLVAASDASEGQWEGLRTLYATSCATYPTTQPMPPRRGPRHRSTRAP